MAGGPSLPKVLKSQINLHTFFRLSHPSTPTLSPFPAPRVRWLAPVITWSGLTPIGVRPIRVVPKGKVMEQMEKGMVVMVLLTLLARVAVYVDNRLCSFCLLKACLILEQVPTVRYTQLAYKPVDIKSIGQVLSLEGCKASCFWELQIFLCSWT